MNETLFVICPIGEENSEIRANADALFNHAIEPACDKFGIKAIRSDKIAMTGTISSGIIQYLKDSVIVIADLTGHNPNVFYELGIRHALSKPAILIKDKKESRPFDIQSISILDYDSYELEDMQKLKTNLIKLITSIKEQDATIIDPYHNLFQDHVNTTDMKESVDNINLSIKLLHQEIINTFSPDALNKTRINAQYLNGEDEAFEALTKATKNAKKEIRSSRFFPDSVLTQQSYVSAIEGRVTGSDGKKPINQYYRIVALNNPDKISDIIHHITMFKGRAFSLHLSKIPNAFELVVIDETDAFIHFYKEKQVISSTLHIKEKSIVWEFKEIYDKMLKNTEEDLVVDCSKITSRNIGENVEKITKIFNDMFPSSR